MTISRSTGGAQAQRHYQHGLKQPIEVMQDIMTPEQLQGFLWGNCLKYSERLFFKGNALGDAQKLQQYAKWLEVALKGEKIDPKTHTI